MPSLVIPNAIQVRLKWQFANGALGFNVLTAQSASATQPTQAITNTVGAAIKARYVSSGLQAQQDDLTLLQKVGLRWIGGPNFAEFEDAGAAVAGTGAGDAMPATVALVVTIRTALAGKSFRGRVYLSGWGELANSAVGNAINAATTAAASFVNGIATDLAASGYTLGVGSRERPANPLAVPPVTFKPAAFTPISAAIVRDATWDTQRRRAR